MIVNPQPVRGKRILEKKMIMVPIMTLGIRLVQFTAFPVCPGNILHRDAVGIKSPPALRRSIRGAMGDRVERGKHNERHQHGDEYFFMTFHS